MTLSSVISERCKFTLIRISEFADSNECNASILVICHTFVLHCSDLTHYFRIIYYTQCFILTTALCMCVRVEVTFIVT